MIATNYDLTSRLNDRIAAWRAEAERFEKHGCAEVAATYKILTDELERDLIEDENELLSIKEAAAESGYSEETLRRRVRKGKILAERSNGKNTHLRIRRRDLCRVRRAGRVPEVDSPASTAYDPLTDARNIAQRQETTHG